MSIRVSRFCIVFALAVAASAAVPLFADGELGTATLENDILTLSGLVTNITAEADLGASVTQVVMTAEGGVAFGATLTAAKNYVVDGTGIVSVAEGKTFSTTAARLATKGHTLVKDGPGTLTFSANVGAVAVQTRWIVRDGKLNLATGGDFFGQHGSTTTNLTIELCEETTLYFTQAANANVHSPIGPLEMTGASLIFGPSTYGYNTARQGNTAFKGGVTVHASATPCYMTWPRYSHLNHVNPDCVFNIEEGGKLIVDGILTNGVNASWNGDVQSVLTKRGGGELVLLKRNGWTGGTVFEGGTITVAHPEALGKSTLTIAGDVTINVPTGVTFVCPPLAVDGTHTLTVTGGGVFTQPASVPEGLTIANNAAGNASPLVGSTLYLAGGTITLPVSADQIITSMVDDGSGAGKYTDIVKTGAGTLTLPAGISESYRNLIVKEGLVSVSATTCFGWGKTTVNGGGIRYTANVTMTQVERPIIYEGSGVIDVPAGVRWMFRTNTFSCANAVVTKTGAGTWQSYDPVRWTKGAIDNARWVIQEGKLKCCPGDMFEGHTGTHNLVIEVQEDAVMEAYSSGEHTPVCSIVLRGGTLNAFYGQFTANGQPIDGGSRWKGWGLNGPITALPSQNGNPSRIVARACHLHHGNDSAATTFDVQDGAVLEIDAILQPGRKSDTTQMNSGSLVKKGKGTLKFLQPCGAKGSIDIQEGAVELAAGVHFDPAARVSVAPNAKLVLGDKAQVANTVDLASALCASADVWLDASRIAANDGATVSSVPNYGTAGGEFAQFTWTTSNRRIPALPTYKANGINGKGVLHFNGVQALCLPTYTNKTENLKVFYVSQWTHWELNGGLGRWGGPFSFANRRMPIDSSGDDNYQVGVLSYQHQTAVNHMVTYVNSQAATITSISGMNTNIPYLVSSFLTKTQHGSTVYVNDGITPQSVTANHTANSVDVEFVCVGGRTCKGGAAQVSSTTPTSGAADRMYIGDIAEMLAFTRTVTAAEEEQILAYLKRKWFNSSVTVSEETEKALANTVRIEVPEGAEAGYVASVDGKTAGTSFFDMTKTGAGTLRYGGAVTGGAILDVEEGGLKLKDGALPSQVDVWIDAADASTIAVDGDGRVTNLVNKGAAGGSFVRNDRWTAHIPYGPMVKTDAEGMNGNPVLAFDGRESLVLNSYTNYTSPREVYLYMVKRRMKWELNSDVSNGGGLGKWGSPFALGSATATKSDEQVPGVIHVSENTEAAAAADFGNNGSTAIASPALGTAEIFYFFNTSNGYFIATETNATSATAVPRIADVGQSHERLAIDLVQLGGRFMQNGYSQWYGDGDNRNRMWYGDIAELIITTMPLGQGQEEELLAYLRKKWLNKGSGSTTPPAWLSGMPATPATDADTALVMAGGTSLQHEAATKTLGALVTEGTVDWTRVWDGVSAESFALFSVDGDVSLGMVMLTPEPKPTQAKVLDWTGTLASPATWRLVGEGASSSGVNLRAAEKAYWINPVGTLLFFR